MIGFVSLHNASNAGLTDIMRKQSKTADTSRRELGLLKGVGLNHRCMRQLGRTPTAYFAQSPVRALHERGLL